MNRGRVPPLWHRPGPDTLATPTAIMTFVSSTAASSLTCRVLIEVFHFVKRCRDQTRHTACSRVHLGGAFWFRRKRFAPFLPVRVAVEIMYSTPPPTAPAPPPLPAPPPPRTTLTPLPPLLGLFHAPPPSPGYPPHPSGRSH